jgi:hypothetical protein
MGACEPSIKTTVLNETLDAFADVSPAHSSIAVTTVAETDNGGVDACIDTFACGEPMLLGPDDLGFQVVGCCE